MHEAVARSTRRKQSLRPRALGRRSCPDAKAQELGRDSRMRSAAPKSIARSSRASSFAERFNQPRAAPAAESGSAPLSFQNQSRGFPIQSRGRRSTSFFFSFARSFFQSDQ